MERKDAYCSDGKLSLQMGRRGMGSYREVRGEAG